MLQIAVVHLWKPGTTLIGPDAALPYGSVITPVGRMAALQFASAVRLHLGNPWAPLIVTDYSPADAAMFTGLGAHPDSVIVRETTPGSVAVVREMVTHRPRPTIEHLQRYVGQRYGRPAGYLVQAAATPIRVGRRTSRDLARNRLPPVEFWAPMLQLLQAISVADATGTSQELAALEVGLSPKPAAEACRRMFGLTWAEVESIGLWEVRVEIAIGRATNAAPSPWHGAALRTLLHGELVDSGGGRLA